MSQGQSKDAGWVEMSGKTVGEATEAGLRRLGLESAEEAIIEVLEGPRGGLLGVIGGRMARVRLRPKADKAEGLARLAREIVEVLGLTATEVSILRDTEGYIRVTLTGPGLGILIGRRGETLDALQYLLNLAAARLPGRPERVILDAGGYRERRRDTLVRLAKRIAESVRRTGREITLEPMTPQERKVIHTAIAAEEGVTSESSGEEPYRRVVVRPVEGRRAGEGKGPDEGNGPDEGPHPVEGQEP